ncbi:hypothetical protein ACQUJT_15995 [Ralstonia pseudosolanacearum]
MDHLAAAPHLRPKFDALPIKTARVFKQQLLQSGVVVAQGGKAIEDVEKRIFNRRHGRMTALSLTKLEKLNLYATPAPSDYSPPP